MGVAGGQESQPGERGSKRLPFFFLGVGSGIPWRVATPQYSKYSIVQR